MTQLRKADIIFGILVFGSIWGLLEATLGGFLNMVLFPNKGAIMAGIGVAIMAASLAVYRKAAMTVGIGLVAASFKLLNVWIFVPISYHHVLNPAVAIIFEALAFGLIAVFLQNRIARSATAGIGVGVLAGLVTATAFVYFALGTGSPILARLGVSGPANYVATSGVVQAAIWGICVPLGYRAGEMFTRWVPPTLSGVRGYAAAALTIMACWGISAVAIALGL